jgi:uncharacterized protein
MLINWAHVYRRRWLWVYLPIGLMALAAFVWLSSLFLPAVPDKITITSGPVDGMYHQHAQRYAEFFRRHGLIAEIVTSAGSAQNIERLRDNDTPNQIGFVQGGFGAIDRALTSEARASIQTLVNVDIEPIWIFTRSQQLDSLLQLQGQRVSIGRVGSGSRVVALKLLEQLRMDPKTMLPSDKTGLEAVNALVQDQLDAAIFVAAPNAPVVKAMLRAQGVYLMQLKQTAAFTERIAYLDAKLVAQGTLDPSSSQPMQDTILLTTVASLVGNENMHPALKRLATAAAMQVHQEATPMSKAGDFPNLKHVDFPLAPDARNTLLYGLSWTEQHLNVDQALWVRRLAILGLPLALLAWLVCRFVPVYLSWTLEGHVNRWYGELKFIEHDVDRYHVPIQDFARHHSQLAAIDSALSNFDAPKTFIKRLYILRQHVDFVRQKLNAKRAANNRGLAHEN